MKPPEEAVFICNDERETMSAIELQKIENIINPEVPELPEEKLELLKSCLAVIASGGRVEGVTPNHVSIEGLQTIKRERNKVGKSAVGATGLSVL